MGIDVSSIISTFSLNDKYVLENDVVITGKSGAKHRFDLIVRSKDMEDVKIAVLNDISDDLVNDIMKFNAMASDVGIQLKVLAYNRDLDDTELNLTKMYNIVAIDQRKGAKQIPRVFGIKKLDNALNGLMRKGYVYMISGKTGVGKTTSCTQFLVEGARQGEKGAIILTDTRGSEYIANAKTFSFGFESYYKQGLIEVIELSDRIREIKPELPDEFTNSRRYISKLMSEIKKLVANSNIKRIAIDPITPMIVENNDFINQFFISLPIPQTYMIVTSGVRKSDISVYGIEEYYVSGLIKLEMEDSDSNLRKATLIKVRGGTYDTTPFRFEINSDGIVPA